MGTRGRKSAAQLAIAPQIVEIVPRPVAPGDLTDEQAVEWDAVVYCFRVARRMSLTTFSADSLRVPDFCLISTPWRLR